MCEQDESKLKNTLKMRQSKLTSLKNENSKHFEDTILKKLNLLYDCLVSKYEKLMIKHTEIGKNLKISMTENTRFKLAMQRLIKNIVQLTGCRVDRCLENDSFENDAFYLQEYCNKLIRELSAGIKRVELLEELNTAEEQMTASRESMDDLQKCADNLVTMERQDRTGENWQAVYERLSLEIADSARVKKHLLEAMSTKVDMVDLIKRSAAEYADELRAKIDTLKAELANEAARERALREKIVRSEGSRREDAARRNSSASSSLLEPQLESDDDQFDSCSSTADD